MDAELQTELCSMPPAAAGPGPAAGGDWRAQILPDARSRVANKIMETLKEHLPLSVPDGLEELRKIAVRFEDKIFSIATDQSNYIRRISLKMCSLDTKITPRERDLNINEMMGTLMKHLLAPGPEELNELQIIACRFEKKIYTAANNKSDYTSKISVKMLSLEMVGEQVPRNAQVIPNQNNLGQG